MNKIEAAKPKDVSLILTMIHELAEWEGYSDQVEATEEILTESLFGVASISKVLIAYIDNQPVGYLIYCPKIATYTGRNEIYLQDLYLRKKARGSGLGLALMSELAKIALVSKATRIEWFVDENNT
ncbi:MAG: GNAT family N-acetyltransferase, partial [Cocleimonas sp.]